MDNQKIFNHLHVHSEFSMRDAVSKINAIVDKAIEIGSTAIALTDHGNMHGVIDFYKACKKKGIKPIIGCEMYVIENKELVNDINRKHEKYHIIFLAKDNIGYHQIVNSVTRGQLLKDKDAYPRVTYEDMKEIFVGNHVICLSACVNGEVAHYLRENNIEKAKEVANFYRSVFGDDYYFELQDHNLMIELEYFNKLVCLGKEMNIPLVATNDAHYINREDYKIREMVVALRFGKTLKESEPDCQELYIKNYDEMEQLFYQWPEAISNTVEIANKCNIDGILVEGVVSQSEIVDDSIVYTLTDIPENLSFDIVSDKVISLLNDNRIEDSDYSFLDETANHMSKYVLKINNIANVLKKQDVNEEKFFKLLKEELGKIVHVKHFPNFHVPDGFENEKDYITHLAFTNFEKKYPVNAMTQEKKQEIVDRINYELGVICDLHYEGYLLIVADFINKGKTLGLIGPGRGSAVGSIVCYLIGITSVDPLPYKLIFERFLNKDRVSDPDIDTDFAPMIREMVIDYVKEIYGENSVCQIVTFGSMGAKASVKNAGRVHGFPIPTCDRISKLIPNTPGITLKDVLEGNIKKEISPTIELVEEIKKDSDIAFLIQEAKKLEGLIIQTGIHAAGVIIADDDVSKYCPLSFDSKKNIWVTQYAKNSCEHDVGLLKMDFLGLENLNIIKRTFDDIKRIHGVELTLDDIDETNEVEVKEVLQNIFVKGCTKGVFQFESDGMVGMLKQYKPRTIEDLILLNAAYRPGPLQYLSLIINIKNGKEKAVYLCPEMKKILEVTFSKPIYQEQIQQIFHDVADFTLGEADIVRRAMSKKNLKELEKYFPTFKKRLLDKGISKKEIDGFCDELMDFAKYAFNKSHATAYAIVAYQTAWLKYYYPVEYMANLLTSTTIKHLPIYINECKTMGIPVLPPDINISGLNFTPTEEKNIRFGLKIKNAGSSCEDIILDREKNGEYVDMLDFINRMIKVKSRATHSNVINSYVLAGTFDSFGYNRHQLYDGMINYQTNVKQNNETSKELDALKQELLDNEKVLDSIQTKYNIDKNTLFEYSKNCLKFTNAYEKAKANNDVAKMDNSISNRHKIFDFLASNHSIAIEENELYDDFNNYATISSKCIRLSRSIEHRETKIDTLNANLSDCIDMNLKEYDRDYILENEKKILGFYASGHPLDSYKKYIDKTSSVLLGNIDVSYDKRKVIIVGRISNVSKLFRKKDNKEMCKFDIEDLTGEVSAICFTKPYEKYKDFFIDGNVVVITARVEIDEEFNDEGDMVEYSVQLNVSSVELADFSQNIFIKVDDLFQWNQIKPIVDECQGNNNLFVYFNDNKKMYQYNEKVTSYDILKNKLDGIEIHCK